MPFVQRNEQGLIVGCFANPQSGYAEEWVPDSDSELTFVSPQQLAIDERTWRNSQLRDLIWLRDRHRDQLEIGVNTTLSVEQFSVLLVYMQALRDWPQADAFPESSGRPQVPQLLELCGGER